MLAARIVLSLYGLASLQGFPPYREALQIKQMIEYGMGLFWTLFCPNTRGEKDMDDAFIPEP